MNLYIPNSVVGSDKKWSNMFYSPAPALPKVAKVTESSTRPITHQLLVQGQSRIMTQPKKSAKATKKENKTSLRYFGQKRDNNKKGRKRNNKNPKPTT